MSDIPNQTAPAGVAGQPAAAQPAAVAAGGSVPLFGGHRGGGKKRADGLPAGSPEALAADRKKNAERMRLARERARGAALPAPLPAMAGVAPVAPAGDPGPALAGGECPLPPAPAGLVVPWSVRLLEKPAKLITRILDRLRCGKIVAKVDKTALPAEVKAEIKRDAAWKDSARDDFATSLAECAAIELNKRRVNASEGHWINLGLSAGELALAHFDLCARIDKLVEAAGKETEKNKTPGA